MESRKSLCDIGNRLWRFGHHHETSPPVRLLQVRRGHQPPNLNYCERIGLRPPPKACLLSVRSSGLGLPRSTGIASTARCISSATSAPRALGLHSTSATLSSATRSTAGIATTVRCTSSATTKCTRGSRLLHRPRSGTLSSWSRRSQSTVEGRASRLARRGRASGPEVGFARPRGGALRLIVQTHAFSDRRS